MISLLSASIPCGRTQNEPLGRTLLRSLGARITPTKPWPQASQPLSSTWRLGVLAVILIASAPPRQMLVALAAGGPWEEN
jgi:hypothetical protein